MINKYIPKKKGLKNKIVATVFFVLSRGIRGTVKIDSNAKETFNKLEDGFVLRILVAPDNASMILKKQGDNFVKIKAKELKDTKVDLDIVFKSVEGALPLVLGLSGVSQAYAENRFIMKGDIGDSMRVVDLINLTEAYLFPKFITSRFMDVIPKKTNKSIRAYLYVLFNI